MRVFIDASAWIAIYVANDIYHKAAKQRYELLKKRRDLFYTNDYALAEVYTRLIYSFHLKIAKKFHHWIKIGVDGHQLSILEVDPAVRERTWRELQKYSDHKLSFTDATIIANFKNYHLDEIFTFDKHFRDINLPTSLVNIG